MQNELERCVERLGKGLRAFAWHDRIAYGDWLSQTYWYVRHSTRLFAASAARLEHDDIGNALHVRFAAHMAERKRLELLAMHDLRELELTLVPTSSGRRRAPSTSASTTRSSTSIRSRFSATS